MIKWIKVSKTERPEGTDIRYESADLPGVAIESRKRHIPHAGGNGYMGRTYWDHTTYFLIKPDGSEKEFYSLKDAKKSAEKGETA